MGRVRNASSESEQNEICFDFQRTRIYRIIFALVPSFSHGEVEYHRPTGWDLNTVGSFNLNACTDGCNGMHAYTTHHFSLQRQSATRDINCIQAGCGMYACTNGCNGMQSQSDRRRVSLITCKLGVTLMHVLMGEPTGPCAEVHF